MNFLKTTGKYVLFLKKIFSRFEKRNIYIPKIIEEINILGMSSIGFVAFCDNSITWLYVEPKFFRNGYGRMLLDFVLNRISKPASVTVLNNNFRAIALYKSCGFKVHSEKKGIIPLTNVEVISLKMVLSR